MTTTVTVIFGHLASVRQAAWKEALADTSLTD